VSQPPRFLFDECVGKPAMEQLQRMVPGNPCCSHLRDTFAQGTPDDKWIPALAGQEGLIVISGDRGKQSGIKPKLPDLCEEHQITHVLLSAAVHRMKSHEKVAALALVWDQIAALDKHPAGTRCILRLRQSKKNAGLLVVLEMRNRPDPPEASPSQGQ
jgi:PIN like domain